MIIFSNFKKTVFISLFYLSVPTFAKNIGEFKIGMSSKDASALGIYYCEPNRERIRETNRFYESTVCKFSIDGNPPPKKGFNELVINNSSRRVQKISIFLLTNNFKDKPIDIQKLSKDEINKWVDDQIFKNYKIPYCPKEYYPNKIYKLNKVCIFSPDIIRWIGYPAYISRGYTVLGTAITIEIYSNSEEYLSIIKNTAAVEKNIKNSDKYKEDQKKIANEIQKGF